MGRLAGFGYGRGPQWSLKVTVKRVSSAALPFAVSPAENAARSNSDAGIIDVLYAF